MGPVTTKAEASALERATYLESGLTVQAGIDEAIRLLRFQELVLSCGEDLAHGSDAVRRLLVARAGVEAELIGFLWASFRFRVPDSEVEADIRRLSQELFETTPDEPADEILGRARSLLRCWWRTRPADLPAESGSTMLPRRHDPTAHPADSPGLKTFRLEG